MYNNDLLEAWAHTLPVPFPVHVPQGHEEKQLNQNVQVVTYKSVSGAEDTPNTDGIPLEEATAPGNLLYNISLFSQSKTILLALNGSSQMRNKMSTRKELSCGIESGTFQYKHCKINFKTFSLAIKLRCSLSQWGTKELIF